MSLSPEQTQAVASWVAAGDSLSVIQKKLSEQFKVSMTYMDVRFLVDDLGLELKNAVKSSVEAKADLTKARSSTSRTPWWRNRIRTWNRPMISPPPPGPAA